MKIPETQSSILAQGTAKPPIECIRRKIPLKWETYRLASSVKIVDLLSLTECALQVLNTYTVVGPLLLRKRALQDYMMEQPFEPLSILVERQTITVAINGVRLPPSKQKVTAHRKMVYIPGINLSKRQLKRLPGGRKRASRWGP